MGFCGGPAVKNPPVLEMRCGPWVRRSPGEGNGHLFHSCVGNPTDRGTWWAAVREAEKESDLVPKAKTTSQRDLLQRAGPY